MDRTWPMLLLRSRLLDGCVMLVPVLTKPIITQWAGKGTAEPRLMMYDAFTLPSANYEMKYSRVCLLDYEGQEGQEGHSLDHVITEVEADVCVLFLLIIITQSTSILMKYVSNH